MATDGKQVEELVAFVEKTLLPEGFEVKPNRRVYADGGQIAEFDVEITGKVGSGKFSWLIECRDRPADGPAPGSWIEQLLGRRTRFGFNKVTVVSTTGFASGAIEFARAQGIELREVKFLAPEEFSSWLALRFISQIKNYVSLERAIIIADPNETEDRKKAFSEYLAAKPKSAFLKRCGTNERVGPEEAFRNAVDMKGGLFGDLIPEGPGKRVTMSVQYTNDNDHYVVETNLGEIRVQTMHFVGVLAVKEIIAPLISTSEYRDIETGKAISQLAVFGEQEFSGKKFSLEMHRIAETGETSLVLRRKDIPDA